MHYSVFFKLKMIFEFTLQLRYCAMNINGVPHLSLKLFQVGYLQNICSIVLPIYFQSNQPRVMKYNESI